LVRKVEGKKTLGRTTLRWVENIKMYIREKIWVMDWIHLAQNRDQWLALVNTIMKNWVP
jgi:hypothetical protein